MPTTLKKTAVRNFQLFLTKSYFSHKNNEYKNNNVNSRITYSWKYYERRY